MNDNVSLKKASTFYLIGSLFNKGIGFITVPIFTRILTLSDYGIVTTYNSWVSIISMFISLALYMGIRLSFVDYENKMIDENKYYQVDNLLKSGLELTNVRQGNILISSSFTGEKEFALDGNIQFDVETGDVYGNVDLTAQTALDVNPYTHHVYFDRVPQDNDSLLLAKYYGNDNSSNPMRINMQQKNISAIFDLFNDLPEDHTIQKLMNYIGNY